MIIRSKKILLSTQNKLLNVFITDNEIIGGTKLVEVVAISLGSKLK